MVNSCQDQFGKMTRTGRLYRDRKFGGKERSLVNSSSVVPLRRKAYFRLELRGLYWVGQ